MGLMKFGARHYTLLVLKLLFAVQAVNSANTLRSFFVVGNMANTLADVDRFLEEGANAIEVDVRFSDDGNAIRVYHGFPCDCFLDCEGETSFAEYLDYIREVTSVGGKYQNKLGLLYLDLKAGGIPPNNFYQAGVDVVNHVVEHLWKDISVLNAVNVLLYVNGVYYKEVFKGAVDTIGALSDSEDWKKRVGFDFGPFLSLTDVESAFVELGITAHRWQGDGASNCIEDMLGSLLISSIVDCRDGQSSTCDYVDKAYVWNIDKSIIIEKMIKAGIDAVFTNKPATVLGVLSQPDVASLVRIAGPQDNPWTRILIVP